MTPLARSVATATRRLARYQSAVDRIEAACLRLTEATARREAMEAAYLAKWGRPAR